MSFIRISSHHFMKSLLKITLDKRWWIACSKTCKTFGHPPNCNAFLIARWSRFVWKKINSIFFSSKFGILSSTYLLLPSTTLQSCHVIAKIETEYFPLWNSFSTDLFFSFCTKFYQKKLFKSKKFGRNFVLSSLFLL